MNETTRWNELFIFGSRWTQCDRYHTGKYCILKKLFRDIIFAPRVLESQVKFELSQCLEQRPITSEMYLNNYFLMVCLTFCWPKCWPYCWTNCLTSLLVWNTVETHFQNFSLDLILEFSFEIFWAGANWCAQSPNSFTALVLPSVFEGRKVGQHGQWFFDWRNDWVQTHT